MTAPAPTPVHLTATLFRIVTVRDEIIVGFLESDYVKVHGRDASAISRALIAAGELTLWQYAVRKAKDGELEQAPLQRVSIRGANVLRVEPYATPLRIVPAPQVL